MLRIMRILPLVFVCIVFPLRGQGVSEAQAETAYLRIVPESYCCLHAGAPLRIDGRAEEEAWRKALWTAEFVDIQGDLRPAPRFRTRVKMLWDEVYFYVYAELDEPHVWARLRQRDTVIFYDNDFEIFVCPDGSNHTYYEYEVNAFNTVWDLFLPKPYRDGGPADNGWDIDGLRSAVHVRGSINDASDTDAGWNVEVAIPWAAFDRGTRRVNGDTHPVAMSAPVPGERMRVNFSRVQWRHRIEGGVYRKVENAKEDNWVWSPQGVINMHRPEKWGWVHFFDDPVGCLDITPDEYYPVHIALMRVYWQQKAYFKKHGRYAKTQADPGPPPNMRFPRPMEFAYRVRPGGKGFTASYIAHTADGRTVRIDIDEFSKISQTVETP